jgi:hypothetical protein
MCVLFKWCAAASDTVGSRKLLTIGPDDIAAVEAVGQAGIAAVSQCTTILANAKPLPAQDV